MTVLFVRPRWVPRRDYVRGGFPYLALIVLALIAPRAAEASTYRWQAAVDGNWNDPANWTLVEGPAGAGYPNGSGDTAQFDGFRPCITPSPFLTASPSPPAGSSFDTVAATNP